MASIEPGDGAVENGTFERLDAVASGLVRTPGARPVVGLVSGPLGWGARLASGRGQGLPIDPVEAIDAASDLAADRIRHWPAAGCSASPWSNSVHKTCSWTPSSRPSSMRP